MKKTISLLFLVFTIDYFLYAQGVENWYEGLSRLAGVDKNSGSASMLSLVIPPGGLYQAMGTAYTAMLKDAGYIESNPAGSAFLQDTELSIYHHDWIGESRIESIIFTVRINQLGLGLAGKFFYVPFTAVNNWGKRYQSTQNFEYAKGYYTEFVGTVNSSYNFFDNYYFSGISLGCNLKFATRNVPEVIAKGQSGMTGMVDLGAVTRFNFLKFYSSQERNTSVGICVRNIGFPVLNDPLPSIASFGLAYSPWRPAIFSADLKIPFLLGRDYSQAEQIFFAFGAHVAILQSWNAQVGLELKPGRPRLSLGSSVNLENLTVQVNYVADLVTSLQPFDRMSIDIKLNLGALGRKEVEAKAHELYLSGLERYAQGDLHEAILAWEQVLKFLPIFQPAQDMIDISQQALDLQRKMQEKQKLE